VHSGKLERTLSDVVSEAMERLPYVLTSVRVWACLKNMGLKLVVEVTPSATNGGRSTCG
jgi:hypothetical protein